MPDGKKANTTDQEELDRKFAKAAEAAAAAEAAKQEAGKRPPMQGK